MLVALPALRLQGLYLALGTLAFGLFMDSVFFSDSRVFGSFGTATIPRLDIPGLDLQDDRAYVVFLSAVFGLLSADRARACGGGRSGGGWRPCGTALPRPPRSGSTSPD